VPEAEADDELVIELGDEAWHWLGATAERFGMTREELASWIICQGLRQHRKASRRRRATEPIRMH
jgi:hypothetical protein